MQEPNIDPKLLKPYDPKETEDRIYKIWEESGFFNPDVCIEKGVTDKDALWCFPLQTLRELYTWDTRPH